MGAFLLIVMLPRGLDFLNSANFGVLVWTEISVPVAFCEIFTRCKAPRSWPQDLLYLLPITVLLCSFDFVIGLPPAKDNMVILVLMDSFFKACKFMPLPKLSSAKETVELLLQHMVRIHGTREQCMWKTFCQLMGASLSLSSDFYPETNSQTDRAVPLWDTLESSDGCVLLGWGLLGPPIGLRVLPGSENTKQMPCPDSGSLWDLTPLWNKNSHSLGLGPTPSGAGGISGRPYGRSQILEVVPLVNCQPPAKDNMVILFLVDSFSKTSKFMSLPKLSSAK
ncbi:hypothetical protein AOLI_G00197610 [Acnodon oligacanthus]